MKISPQSSGKNLMVSMKNILKEHIAELHNVTWPTKKQAIHSMVMVVVIMMIVGIFLAFLDNGLGQGFQKVLDYTEQKASEKQLDDEAAAEDAGQKEIPSNSQQVPADGSSTLNIKPTATETVPSAVPESAPVDNGAAPSQQELPVQQ